MPELPEVQCVVDSLQRIVGKKVGDVEILANRLREPFQHHFAKDIKGRTIEKIERLGKYLVFSLDMGFLVAHLGMTGKFLINGASGVHDRVKFSFEGGDTLVYNDIRKFGFLLYETSLEDNKYIRKLGVEPLSKAFCSAWLASRLSAARKKTIKQFLLDQSEIAGLGNIYVLEVLYICKISPLRPVDEISSDDISNMVVTIKIMLAESIAKGGSTISDYRDADNKSGSFQDGFHVYGRKSDNFGHEVVRVTQNGRGTYYCPVVQI